MAPASPCDAGAGDRRYRGKWVLEQEIPVWSMWHEICTLTPLTEKKGGAKTALLEEPFARP